MSTGLIFGKFAPLHLGHINMVIKASALVDTLHVVLSYDQKFNDTLEDSVSGPLTKANRHLALLETFKDFDNIIVNVIDESAVPGYPEGEGMFTNMLKKKTRILHFDKVFTSEPSYDKYLKDNFPDSEHIVVDANRDEVTISATMIRGNPYKYWDFIAPAMRKHYVKKVCVIGIESTGKSTLVKKLSKALQTIFVEEVGRTICEQEYGLTEAYMKPEDYVYVAMKHKMKEKELLPYANKVLLSDTNAVVTDFSMNTFNNLEHYSPLLSEICFAEKYDLVLYLRNDVPWVEDPLRKKSTQDAREKSQKVLDNFVYNVYKVYEKCPVIQIGGTYENRFNEAMKEIKKLIGS